MQVSLLPSFPKADHLWLRNASILPVFLSETRVSEGLVDLELYQGRIQSIQPVASRSVLSRDALSPQDPVEPQKPDGIPTVDLQGGMVWPCFVDVHAHLDKGHIWPRSPNPDGTFATALEATHRDRERYWSAEDLYPRMNFGIRSAYAHGTQAIRTHLDIFDPQGEISLDVFRQLRQEWQGRLTLQGVSLATADYYETTAGETVADLIADTGGILGAVLYRHPDNDRYLDRILSLALERGLALDFHCDETQDPHSHTLRQVAQAVVRRSFPYPVVCGHCCSLGAQSPPEVEETLRWVKAARIGIISLPMCNLYLQDRQAERTPRWRGVTLLKELQAQRIPVALAGDNVRDPFHGFGDHDMLEVFQMGVRIGHLDVPYESWPQSVNRIPAQMMGLSEMGRIPVGGPADLVLFSARSLNELMSRPQHDRIVLRQGIPIDTTLPDYRELDGLFRSA